MENRRHLLHQQLLQVSVQSLPRHLYRVRSPESLLYLVSLSVDIDPREHHEGPVIILVLGMFGKLDGKE